MNIPFAFRAIDPETEGPIDGVAVLAFVFAVFVGGYMLGEFVATARGQIAVARERGPQ
jgi:hypothetical protein